MLGKVRTMVPVSFFSRGLRGLCLLSVFVGLSRAHAAQVAVVIAERAIVWADIQRSAPLGFIRKGKVITVGEVLRNKKQVIPIVVSARVGYIAIDDIQLGGSKEVAPEENRYERFYNSAIKTKGEQIVFFGSQFYSTENKNSAARRDGETWNFYGGGLKGEIPTESERVSFVIQGEYTYARSVDHENFRMFSLGAGFDFTLIQFRYLRLRGEVIGQGAYGQYELKPLFTLNTWGMGLLGQGLLDVYFGEHWGIEAALGLQAMKFFRVQRPAPYKNFSPLFSGVHGSLGAVYRF